MTRGFPRLGFLSGRGRSAAPAGPGPAGLSAAAAERAVSATGGRPSWLALAKTAGCLAVTGASSQVIDTNVQKKGKIRPERYRSEPPKSSRPPLNVARQKLPFDCYFNCGEMTALLGEMVCSQRRLSPGEACFQFWGRRSWLPPPVPASELWEGKSCTWAQLLGKKRRRNGLAEFPPLASEHERPRSRWYFSCSVKQLLDFLSVIRQCIIYLPLS